MLIPLLLPALLLSKTRWPGTGWALAFSEARQTEAAFDLWNQLMTDVCGDSSVKLFSPDGKVSNTCVQV